MTIAKKINKIITKREFQRFLDLSLKDLLTTGMKRIAYMIKTIEIIIEKKKDSMPIIGFFKGSQQSYTKIPVIYYYFLKLAIQIKYFLPLPNMIVIN